MPRHESRELVDTVDGKRIKVVRREERLLDKVQVEGTVADLDRRIAWLTQQLAEAEEARDDLADMQDDLE